MKRNCKKRRRCNFKVCERCVCVCRRQPCGTKKSHATIILFWSCLDIRLRYSIPPPSHSSHPPPYSHPNLPLTLFVAMPSHLHDKKRLCLILYFIFSIVFDIYTNTCEYIIFQKRLPAHYRKATHTLTRPQSFTKHFG